MDASTLTASVDPHHGRPVMDSEVTRPEDARRIALVALALA